MSLQASDLFTLPESLQHFAAFFPADVAPWEWVSGIKLALKNFAFPALPELPAGVHIEGDVFLGEGVSLPPYAFIKGPAYIGAGCEIRPGAYIRGNVIAGANCVLGNSCEYKNSLLLDNVETAHFNYVGDSVLGNKAHLGAGVICANLKLARDEVVVRLPGGRFPTGLRKLGALLGDGAEVGCNSVLQPGSILGREAAVVSMPWQGYLEAGKIAIPQQNYRTISRGSIGG